MLERMLSPDNASALVIPVTNILPEDIPNSPDTPREQGGCHTISWAGNPIYIKTGETITLPGDVAYHISFKIAQRYLMLKKKFQVANFEKNKHSNYYQEGDIISLQKRILGQTISETTAVVKNHQEIEKERIENIQKEFGQAFKDETIQEEVKATVEEARTKPQVIKDIKKKSPSTKVNVTLTKAQLLEIERNL